MIENISKEIKELIGEQLASQTTDIISEYQNEGGKPNFVFFYMKDYGLDKDMWFLNDEEPLENLIVKMLNDMLGDCQLFVKLIIEVKDGIPKIIDHQKLNELANDILMRDYSYQTKE